MNVQIENLNRDENYRKKNQMKILKLKRTITKIRQPGLITRRYSKKKESMNLKKKQQKLSNPPKKKERKIASEAQRQGQYQAAQQLH